MDPNSSNEEIILTGTAVSPGIAFAPVHVFGRGMTAPEVYNIKKYHVENEIERFKAAIEKTRLQLSSIQKKIEGISGEQDALIFEAHLLILDDKSLHTKVVKGIESRLQNAEHVYYAVIQTYCEAIRRMNDAYLSERAVDIEDVAQRVIGNFESADAEQKAEETNPDHKHVIVSYDLTPSDTVLMDRTKTLGFVTEQGSTTSHTAILARSLGIPAIVGVPDAVMSLRSLTDIILDGYSGKIILNPTPETTAQYRNLLDSKLELEDQLGELKESKTQTTDSHGIILSANIEFDHELPLVEKSGAEGVGLFRTEFYLLGNGEIPDENRQTNVYTKVAKGVKPHLAIIRTLDAGGEQKKCSKSAWMNFTMKKSHSMKNSKSEQ